MATMRVLDAQNGNRVFTKIAVCGPVRRFKGAAVDFLQRFRWQRVLSVACGAFLALMAFGAPHAGAQTSYYQHEFFDNGPRTSAYFYSAGNRWRPAMLN
jgi:hypothetical protein